MEGKKLIALSALFLMVVSSCQLFRSTKPSTALLKDQHNSANSLDWSGYYQGDIRLGNESVRHYLLGLFPDSTYSLTVQNAGVEAPAKQGRFVWRADGAAITLVGEEAEFSHYWVQENRLQLLTAKGDKYKSEVAAQYVLNKNAEMSGLFGKKWYLVSLGGQKSEGANDRIPYLQFDAKENRVNGFAGCNRFFGSFELKENNRLRFKGVGATRMACIDMSVEDRLFEVFDQFDSYILVGNQLQLIKGRMAPLAVFETK